MPRARHLTRHPSRRPWAMRFVCFVFLLLAGHAHAGPEESAVQVRHDEGGSIGYGSGTVVRSGKDGSDILTNHHVAPNPGRFIDVFFDKASYRAKWVRSDSGLDLALLHVDVELPVAELADQPPPPGVRIEQWGFTKGGPKNHKVGVSGVVDGRRMVPGGGEVMTNGIGSEPGDSGSGVFCAGKLVAVCWGSGGPGRESCVVLSDIKAFLGRGK